MKNTCILFLFFFSTYIFACECPSLKPIDKKLSDKYDVIFFGKVDSVSRCEKDGISTAYFTINKLYKGAVNEFVKVDFDCVSPCLMSFSRGDEWLVYTTYQRFDLMTVNICEHSRKLVGDATQDVYQLAAQRTFEQEKQFLLSVFGVQPFVKSNDLNRQQANLKPHNDQPSAINKLILLLVSFLAMLVVYVVSKKYFKNGK